MKRLFFGLPFLGAMAFSNTITIAQTDPGDPGMGGGGENSAGGVCCQSEDSCQHPKFGLVAESTWKSGISFCP